MEKNNIKPCGNACPRCAGYYDWTNEQGHCVICGYRWNPQLILHELKTPHCSAGRCLRPIARLEQIFCVVHQGEIVDRVVRKNIGYQKRRRTKAEHTGDSQIRFNAPIPVRLKKKGQAK